MLIRNVKVYTEDKEFVEGEIVIRGGRIQAVEFCSKAGESAGCGRGDASVWEPAAGARGQRSVSPDASAREEYGRVASETGAAPDASAREEHGRVASEEGAAPDASVREEHGRVASEEEIVIDGEGCYAIPGLVDLHFHGCKGYDFCDGTKEAIGKIAEYEASVGVTAISPATMTLPVNELEEILAVAAEYRREAEADRIGIKAGAPGRDLECTQAEAKCEEAAKCEGTVAKCGEAAKCEGAKECRVKAAADLVGVNMEGPFISEAKKGAQDERHIISCDADICRRFLDASEGLVKFVGIAPERNQNAVEFIREMKDKVHISLAHTNADYDTAMAAFDAGADHAVHLYNAMPAFTHRTPGVVGAVSDSSHVHAEMICDGVHIHPAVVRATFKMLGAERIVLISDSMRATGMPDGQYTLGGLDVNVADGRATLVSNGALAGSATNLMECMKTVVKKMGIPLETAVACASGNPAKCLGIYDEYGSIAPGKRGNVVLLDPELKLKAVVKDGVRIR